VQLREFLLASLHSRARCVRIVHGKGLRSGAKGPVLRALVNRVLRRSAPVLAFASARQVDGGTGALYVLLAGGP
jgi:DNA-nicking Smr family endonuclease